MLASRLTRSLGQGVKLRQEIIEGCCRQKRPGEGRLLQQKRGIVLKRTYSPPLVKSEVIAGGAMTIPVTQVRSKQSNSDHFGLKKKNTFFSNMYVISPHTFCFSHLCTYLSWPFYFRKGLIIRFLTTSSTNAMRCVQRKPKQTKQSLKFKSFLSNR